MGSLFYFHPVKQYSNRNQGLDFPVLFPYFVPMTDKIDISNSNADIPSGFTEKTGPAAFKEQHQATADETVVPFGAAQQEQADMVLADFQDAYQKIETELNSTKDQLLRTVAEMENLRKRSIREREDAGKYAVSSFAKDLLDVADTFRRALDSIPADLRADERINPLVDGIEATERAFLRSFEKNGIRKIEPMDETFNPNFHEVMFEAPVPGKAGGIIIQLIEPGYMLHDRLLRPARVGVAKDDGGPCGSNMDEKA